MPTGSPARTSARAGGAAVPLTPPTRADDAVPLTPPTRADDAVPLTPPTRADARILVVDDEASNVRLLKRLLERAGYTNVATAADGSAALEEYARQRPELVLLDLQMPRMDGFAVLQAMVETTGPAAAVPVLVLTADVRPQARRRAQGLGAHDYLLKPFDVADVLRRVSLLLEVHANARAAFRRLSDLGCLGIGSRRADAELKMLQRLGSVSALGDRMSEGHTRRVGQLSRLLAAEMRLPASLVTAIGHCAPLHDLGKLEVPEEILLKPGPLTAEERALAARHTTIGALILAGSDLPLLRLASDIALTHHERWDGSGYPRGLKGGDIPLAGRIVAVADVFDALTHERPYKSAWPLQRAVAEIVAGSGRHFDPEVVDALLSLLLCDAGSTSIAA